MSSASNAVYIEVPVQVIPFYPNGAPSPEGVGVGGGASLVQSNSITVTEQYPSDIARSAHELMDNAHTQWWVCCDFVRYLELCEQKGFKIRGYDTAKGEMVTHPLSYQNRWAPERRRELSMKLDRLGAWFEMQEDRPVTMITFTPYQTGYSVKSLWFELNKSRDKMRKLIYKYFGDVDYFWVVEPHPENNEGYVHYHMAVFAEVDNKTKDSKGRGIEDKFRDLWSRKYKTGNHTYGLDFSQKTGDKKIKDLKKYLSDYLRKGFLFDHWDQGTLIFNANLWETGFRMYGASRRIREIMNCKPEKKQEIVWLETRMQTPETTPEGDVIEMEKVIWYRQYIHDWIDSDFWIWQGEVRQTDPPPQYIYDWGRPASGRVECKVTDCSNYVSRRRVDDYKLG